MVVVEEDAQREAWVVVAVRGGVARLGARHYVSGSLVAPEG